MKEHIHTIPVMDAVSKSLADKSACPFCLMRGELERGAVDFIMGPAYMEDDVRMETNAAGFCAAHLQKMYAEQNRLGLALMLHTHFKQINKDLETVKKNPGRHLEEVVKSCYVCKRIGETFARYVQTFLKLWADGGGEAAAIESVRGYCLPHFAALLNEAEKLGFRQRTRFKEIFIPLQLKHMKRMEEDLEWFTKKYDYRYSNEPWKNSKDALPRAIDILTGGNHAEDNQLF